MLRSGSLFNRGLRHAARTLPRVAAALALTATGLSSTACSEAKPLHLTVQTPATTLDCARTADRVFFDASYVRMANVLGPNVFYTPRVSPPRAVQGHRRRVDRLLRVPAGGALARSRLRPDLSLFSAARRRRRRCAARHDETAGSGVRVSLTAGQ